jgi:hypothetical protein
MTSHCARGACLFILLSSLTSTAWCQNAARPSLLPIPALTAAGSNYAVSPAAAMTDANWYQGEPAPAPQTSVLPSPSDQPALGGSTLGGMEYYDAMKGGYGGAPLNNCTTCGPCHNHYIYANALLMTHVKQGGFVTSVDPNRGTAEVFFCQPEFGGLWHGGFEIGTGWSFGPNNNSALEVVYWGLFPSTGTATARGTLNSTIDFSDLNYNGANANTFVTNSTIQSVQYGFNFNSVEFNLVGNSLSGGPFGSGMCGFCMGRGGSPWGFGWVGGFRYLNFSENWLFRGDTTDFNFNGDPTELNYRMQLNNNLFGVQLGGGLSYCVSNRLTAYVIGKFGIYDNRVTQFQTVYGTQGAAVINNGPFTGQPFLVRSTDDVFSGAGQFDIGGRWAVSNNWSVNFGYRAMALAGVAISEVNAQHSAFQNLSEIASQETTGSFILHGGYVGATYCW